MVKHSRDASLTLARPAPGASIRPLLLAAGTKWVYTGLFSLLTSQLLGVCIVTLMLFSNPRQLRADPEPIMPTRFDRETVVGLLDSVDRYPNAIILKVGYFDPYHSHTLPVSEGYTLLKNAVAKEPVGTSRWFHLQSVNAWAGTHTKGRARDGLRAYAELFDQVNQADNVNALDVVQRSIYELVNVLSLDSPSGVAGVIASTTDADTTDLKQAKKVLLQALAAHLSLVGQNNVYPLAAPWGQAIRSLGANEESTALVDNALKVSPSKSYALLVTAAAAYQASNPQRSVELLDEAKSLLPANSKEQIEAFYGMLVESLASTNHLGRAAKEQAEFFRLTGRGRAKLVTLVIRVKGDEVLRTQGAFEELLAGLPRQGAGEQDTIDAAQALIDLYNGDKGKYQQAGVRAENLLTSYLADGRSRQVEQELQARLVLGNLYKGQGRIDEAKAVLQVSPFPRSLSTELARFQYAAIQRVLQGLDTK